MSAAKFGIITFVSHIHGFRFLQSAFFSFSSSFPVSALWANCRSPPDTNFSLSRLFHADPIRHCIRDACFSVPFYGMDGFLGGVLGGAMWAKGREDGGRENGRAFRSGKEVFFVSTIRHTPASRLEKSRQNIVRVQHLRVLDSIGHGGRGVGGGGGGVFGDIVFILSAE